MLAGQQAITCLRLLLAALVAASSCVGAPEQAGSDGTRTLLHDSGQWFALPARAAECEATGGLVAPRHSSTVLTTLVSNGTFGDPNIGATNLHIPDVFHAGRCFYTYWFTTNFTLPANATAGGRRARLTFHGINYSARVFVNGQEVELPEPRGMFLRRRVDVTAALPAAQAATNVTLTVLVAPPDNVGNVDRGGQGGDHVIARDVTALFTEGWDWMQPVRDRDTGVFDSVELALLGPVALQDPGVVVDRLQGLEAAAAEPASGLGFPAAATAARLSGEVTFVSAGAAPLRGVLFASVAEAPHAGLRGGAATPCASYRHV